MDLSTDQLNLYQKQHYHFFVHSICQPSLVKKERGGAAPPVLKIAEGTKYGVFWHYHKF